MKFSCVIILFLEYSLCRFHTQQGKQPVRNLESNLCLADCYENKQRVCFMRNLHRTDSLHVDEEMHRWKLRYAFMPRDMQSPCTVAELRTRHG